MTANTKQKGARAERECCGIYESAGYRCHSPKATRYGDNDIFNLFDILAVPESGALGSVHLVQVKCNGARGIESWREDALAYFSRSVTPEMVVRYDGQGGHDPTPPRWRLIHPYADPFLNHRTAIDERHDGVEPDGVGLSRYLRNPVEVSSDA